MTSDDVYDRSASPFGPMTDGELVDAVRNDPMDRRTLESAYKELDYRRIDVLDVYARDEDGTWAHDWLI